MDPAFAPALGAGAKEDRFGRDAVIGAPAIAHERAADVIGHRHEEHVGLGMRDALAYLGRKRWRHTLIGVDLDGPVAMAGVEAGIAARALELPSPLDDPHATRARNRGRAVGRAIEHHHDLIRESETIEAGA